MPYTQHTAATTWTRHNAETCTPTIPTPMQTIPPPIPQTIGTITSKPFEYVKFVQINPCCIAFQTDCLYTTEGQIIVAKKIGNCVIFYDVCRGIDGAFKGELTQGSVLTNYKSGNYEPCLGYGLRMSLLKLLGPHRKSLKTSR